MTSDRMMTQPGDIVCDTPGGRIAVRGAAPIVPLLRHLAPAWPISGAHADADHADSHRADPSEDASVAAMVAASFDGQVWRYQSSAYQCPDYDFPTGLPAANGLVGALLGTMLGLKADWLTLHAGAVEIDGRLVLIIGANMAGKSTLSTALAASGCRLWSDDRVLLIPDKDNGFQCRALGLAAKVRVPLPDDAPDAYRRWIQHRRGVQGDGMMYLQQFPGDSATAGVTLAPSLILIPDRSARGPEFAPLTLNTGQAVKHLVPAAFAPALSPLVRLQTLGRLAGSVPTMILQYRDAFSIVSRLRGGQLTDG